MQVEEHFNKHEHPFMNFETQCQQIQYYKEMFNLIVSYIS